MLGEICGVFSHVGHQYRNTSEMGHRGVHHITTYGITFILMVYNLVYLVMLHEYFQDFRAAQSYQQHLKLVGHTKPF